MASHFMMWSSKGASDMADITQTIMSSLLCAMISLQYKSLI